MTSALAYDHILYKMYAKENLKTYVAESSFYLYKLNPHLIANMIYSSLKLTFSRREGSLLISAVIKNVWASTA